MEPQLIASLYEHAPARTQGQHDILPELGQAARFDTAGVVIAILAMIGLMIAMAMMGGDAASPQPSASMSHLLTSTR